MKTLIILIAIVVVGAMLYLFVPQVRELSPGAGESPEPVFCTADAYQCPDGTWVGRTGPDCQFVCPGAAQ
jgi:hypothetical protein